MKERHKVLCGACGKTFATIWEQKQHYEDEHAREETDDNRS